MKSKFKTNFNSKVMMVVISLVCGITMLMAPTLALAFDLDNSKGTDAQPRWTCLFICDNYIDYANHIKKGIEVYASTTTYPDYYAGVEVQLEKYVTTDIGGIWVNVPTYCWSAYEKGTLAEVYEDDISLSPGVYRCLLEHIARDPGGIPLESEYLYTAEIRIPD